MTVQDKYSYWQAALKGQSPAYHDDTGHGRKAYRFAAIRTADSIPSRSGSEGDDVVCKRGTKIVDADRALPTSGVIAPSAQWRTTPMSKSAAAANGQTS